MKALKAAAAVLVIAVAVAGCRTTMIQPVEAQPYGLTASGARSLSMDQYRNAIVRAGIKRGWVFEEVARGHLVGTVNVRGKHEATVDVYFNTEDFTIRYKDSKNLNYDAAKNTIHPNYNTWVRNLESDIRAEVQTARLS